MNTSSHEEKPIPNSRLFIIFAILSLVEGFLAFIWMISIPADPKNAILLGVSLKRVIMLGVVITGITTLAIVLISYLRNQHTRGIILRWMVNRKVAIGSGILGAIVLLVGLVPSSEWGKWTANIERTMPLIIWAGFLLVQWYFLNSFVSGHIEPLNKKWRNHNKTKGWAIFLAVFSLLAFVYLLSTRLYPGHINEDNWFETGVPILLWQVFLCVGVGIVVNKNKERIQRIFGKKTNPIFFLVIFIAFAVLWSSIPVKPGSVETPPLPPNNTIYPDRDAVDYDLQAQSALLGFGINNNNPLDRPFYPLLLAILHLFTGMGFSSTMWLQAIIFAFLPAIAYLTCVEFTSQGEGVATSLAIGFWGSNTIIANSLLNTANPKQMLTDFFLAVILCFLLYVIVRWFKRGQNEQVYAIFVGGLLGLASYIRYSALALIPIVIILTIVKYRRQFKKGLKLAALISMAFLVFILPWYSRNVVQGKRITLPYSTKVLFVINTRYGGETSDPLSGNTSEQKTGSDTPAITRISKQNDLTKPFISWFSAHLAHNLFGSLLILPTSPEIASFDRTITTGGQIWLQGWDGKLTTGRVVVLFPQLFLLSLGTVNLYKRNKLVIVLILLMFLGINIANALGRTSGGRYIIPVNWIVILVYFAGVFALFGNKEFSDIAFSETKSITRPGRKSLFAVLLVLLVGTSPIIFERVLSTFSPSWLNIPSFEQILSDSDLPLPAEEVSQIQQTLELKNIKTLTGYAFFPIQQRKDQLSSTPAALLKVPESKVVSFYLMRERGYDAIYFPFDKEIEMTNKDLVYTVGCKTSGVYIVSDLIVLKNNQEVKAYHSDNNFKGCSWLSH